MNKSTNQPDVEQCVYYQLCEKSEGIYSYLLVIYKK